MLVPCLALHHRGQALRMTCPRFLCPLASERMRGTGRRLKTKRIQEAWLLVWAGELRTVCISSMTLDTTGSSILVPAPLSTGWSCPWDEVTPHPPSLCSPELVGASYSLLHPPLWSFNFLQYIVLMSKVQEMVKDREAWCAANMESQRVRRDLVTKQLQTTSL